MKMTGKAAKQLICICLALAFFFTLTDSGFAADTGASLRYLDASTKVAGSPIGFVSGGNTVNMKPGQSGQTSDGVKWCLDEAGYFTISFERPGTFKFRLVGLSEENINAEFDLTLLGAGGGGGGAMIEPESVGAGGNGGDVLQVTGLKAGNYSSSYTTVKVGKGGYGGSSWEFCWCGGRNCPYPGNRGVEWAKKGMGGNNDGWDGGTTSFGSFAAKGGKGGEGGGTAGDRCSGIRAGSGRNGANCGIYYFWGVPYRCGFGGEGGGFGGDNGPGGEPTYFHEGHLSYGFTGNTVPGRGNGGGGGGFSYYYGHPMVNGTGTGRGKGSYSVMWSGCSGSGGDDERLNGYVYLEGRVDLSGNGEADGNVVLENFPLRIRYLPDLVSPVPRIKWTTTNATAATVSPSGRVSVKTVYPVVITASANNVQGYYFINGYSSPILISMTGSAAKAGDTPSFSVILKEEGINSYVVWSSTNESVVSVDRDTGKASVNGYGTAVITATNADGIQGNCTVKIG